MNPDVFIELSKILIITLLMTGLVRALRQPAIIGYILSGIICGPFVFNIIDSADALTAFSHIGVALLLFLVGLNLSPKVIKDVGKISLITGIGQVIFTTSVGFAILKLLGFATVSAVYVSVALAFSSTIVIMKLLSDKRDLETLYGRISMGFLIVQDFIAIIILLVISSLSKGVDLRTLAFEATAAAVGGVFILIVLARHVLPWITKMVAKSQEYLLLFSISWCFAVAAVFHYLDFSIEAGALLAGITLSASPYHLEISSRLRPLRDFFLILFFILLGSQMVFSNVLASFWIIMLLSLFVLVGNPIIVMILMGILGYTKRNSFLAGLTVAQISEFSLIVISLGVAVGDVGSEMLSLVTAIGLVTFAGSTYLILYSHKIYPVLAPYLSVFERKGTKVDAHSRQQHQHHDIILIGYNRIGFDILESLKRIKKRFLIVDYDPETIGRLAREGYDCHYGDANDSELLDELNFHKAKMIISTIPDIDTNLLIIAKAKEVNKDVIIAVVSHQIDDSVRLYDEGATYVIMPHFLGGEHFSTMIEKNKLSMERFLEAKIEHMEHLRHRKSLGHEHPNHGDK